MLSGVSRWRCCSFSMASLHQIRNSPSCILGQYTKAYIPCICYWNSHVYITSLKCGCKEYAVMFKKISHWASGWKSCVTFYSASASTASLLWNLLHSTSSVQFIQDWYIEMWVTTPYFLDVDATRSHEKYCNCRDYPENGICKQTTYVFFCCCCCLFLFCA